MMSSQHVKHVSTGNTVFVPIIPVTNCDNLSAQLTLHTSQLFTQFLNKIAKSFIVVHELEHWEHCNTSPWHVQTVLTMRYAP